MIGGYAWGSDGVGPSTSARPQVLHLESWLTWQSLPGVADARGAVSNTEGLRYVERGQVTCLIGCLLAGSAQTCRELWYAMMICIVCVYIYMIWYVILIEHMTDVFDAYNIWLIWHMRFCNKCLTPRTSNSQWNSWVYRHRLSSNKNTFFCLDAGNGLVWRNLSFQKRLGWFIENWIQKKDFALLKIVPPFFEMETTSKNHDFVAGVQKLGTPPFTATADFTFCGFGKEFTRSVPSGYVNSWLLKMTHWNSGFSHW